MMACRIPGCNTKYWDKSNTHRLFKALTVSTYYT